jgi:hypothetical protein
VVRSSEEYGWYVKPYSFLVFGKVKIWGEVVEHERGYRSEFAKILSLDYGDPELLARFRSIYGLTQATTYALSTESLRQDRLAIASFLDPKFT